MPKKCVPSEKIAREMEKMIQGEIGSITELLLKSSSLFIQKTLEAESLDFTGRAWCERRGQGSSVYRNGYESKTISTAEGSLDIQVPQFRNTDRVFESKLLPVLKNRSDSLELLAVQCWIGGMSQADIAEMFFHDLKIPNMSESVVQSLCQGLQESYERFAEQDLSSHDLLYLFLDGIYLPLRKGVKIKEAVLCAIGINRAGKKVLLGLCVGPRESTESWKDFLQDLTSRGMTAPLLAIRDGNPGLIRALSESLPYTAQQTCLAHKAMRLAAKAPDRLKGELKNRFDDAIYAKDYETAMTLCRKLIEDFRGKAESYIKCFEKDLDAMLAYLKFPQNHWKGIRTTNVIERRFEEVRRRTKVIPRFQNERSCLMLCHAVLFEYQRKKPWRGLKMDEEDKVKLEKIRYKLFVEKKPIKLAA